MAAVARDESLIERADRLELPFNEFGVDPYGISKKHIAMAASVLSLLYRNYFRVKCYGLEHVPPRGRGMLVGNHSGGYAIDGAMVITSMFLEMNPPRQSSFYQEHLHATARYAKLSMCRKRNAAIV